MRIGKHVLKGWSSTQAVIALSAGAAEFYGIVRAASNALGMVAMAADLGVQVETIKIVTDATAAKGMSLRRGLGPV